MKVGHAVTNYYMKMEILIKMIVLSTQLHVKNEKVSHFFSTLETIFLLIGHVDVIFFCHVFCCNFTGLE